MVAVVGYTSGGCECVPSDTWEAAGECSCLGGGGSDTALRGGLLNPILALVLLALLSRPEPGWSHSGGQRGLEGQWWSSLGIPFTLPGQPRNKCSWTSAAVYVVCTFILSCRECVMS
ncbi:hypothetical protein E2C01_066662 [Portunus trituberculatus]|uniref:Uncharacterized protein n=1 Tax=Portunus trituberculatus TaxID=210409 RepID=A0A5B7HRH2_PORTR|nr:hypothetical protein [Portunus trituberculatus]